MKAKVKAARFDERFDDGEGVLEDLDLSAARRARDEQKRVNVDFPTWMIELLDIEASRIGVPRQVSFDGARCGSRRLAASGQGWYRPSEAVRRPPARAG